MSNFDSENQESFLYVDIGNSSIKIGFQSSDKWTVHTHETAMEAAKEIKNHIYPVKQIFVCSVREGMKDALEGKIETKNLKEVTIADIPSDKLDYETPETLGIDRYLACLGAYSESEKGVVVIDAGSACTIDYMDSNGVFFGGVIVPGFKSIMNIFKESAPELPDIKVGIPKVFPGKSTTESLQWGQVGFFVDGVISILESYDEKFEDYELYLTGGDAPVLYDLLGHVGEVNPWLVLMGLKKIAQ
ncbi:MAG: type III pantothenate kinase [Balneolaceae bacterium]|nr:type III pantothenate kinase [Balneolaceae bacterium]MBO6546685.1 type III pantothenate kinase [Balneolaceae bacterium]MBO6649043.1 type III pantothenate kinase [Balneolaceae bacterium]